MIYEHLNVIQNLVIYDNILIAHFNSFMTEAVII